MAGLAGIFEGLPLWMLALVIVCLLWLAALAGRALRVRLRSADDGSDPAVIVSASLGMLALLLGFTVAMAVGRYDARRAATLDEGNAIQTAIYRVDLLPPELRLRALDTLGRYLDARITVGRMGEDDASVARAHKESAAQAEILWRRIVEVGQQVPDGATRILLFEGIDQMFSAATVRDTALANRLPPTLVLLLVFFPIVSMLLIGYGGGRMVGVHFMASTELILLLTLVLLLIADLNRPRSGSIETPLTPLLEAQAQLGAARKAQEARATDWKEQP